MPDIFFRFYILLFFIFHFYSTILGQYSYKGGDVQGSGASSITLSAVTGTLLLAFGLQALRA